MIGGAKKKMRTITKMRRATRGLSPIFATLILIAIAVIAGIIVYMFTSGTLAAMMGGGTAGQEKMSIQAVEVTATGVTLHCKSQSGEIALDSAILKNSQGNVVTGMAGVATTGGPVATTLTPITVALTFPASGTYTVTLVTVNGNSFVSPSFQVTA